MSSELRALPASTEAERIALGAAMTDGAAWDAVSALRPADFALEKHKRILAAMHRLAEKGLAVDRVTLPQELSDCGQLESVDGLTYLCSLDDGFPQIFNLPSYIAIIREKSTAREVIIRAQSLIDELCASNGSLGTIQGRIDELSAVSVSNSAIPLRSVGEIVAEGGGMDSLFAPQRGVAMPWPSLAKVMPVLGNGTLTVVAAAPGMGKSAFAGELASRTATAGIGTGIWSLEMTGGEIIKRIVAETARVSHSHLVKGQMDPVERSKVSRALGELDTRPLWLSQNRTVTVAAIRSEAKRAAAAGRKVGLVVVDYLQLMSGKGKDIRERVTEVTRGLKLLAMQLDVPVVALSQLSRESTKEDRRPELGDLRESGSIEQDANNVWFLWAKKAEIEAAWKDHRPVEVQAYCPKHRNGDRGTTSMFFDGRYMRFYEENRGDEEPPGMFN